MFQEALEAVAALLVAKGVWDDGPPAAGAGDRRRLAGRNPPAARLRRLRLAANATGLSDWDHDFQGRPASWLRDQVRREVVALAAGFLERHGLARRRR